MMKWFVAATAILGMYAGKSSACRCIDTGDPRVNIELAVKRADAVFVGRVESSEKLFAGNEVFPIEYERLQIYVVRSWKGDKASRLYVETGLGCCMCGYRFPEDKKGMFLIYALGPDSNGYYRTMGCDRTKPIEEAEKEMAVIDEIAAAK